MSLAVELHENVTLYAGGSTGIVFLDGAGTRAALWSALGERAENEGLSALTFTASVGPDAAAAAAHAAQLLGGLGVERIVLSAAGGDAAAALEASADGGFAALVLVDPEIPEDLLEPLLAETPMPKLVLVTDGNDAQATAIYRYAIGPTVIRQLPPGGEAELAGESILGFTVGVCGDGRPA